GRPGARSAADGGLASRPGVDKRRRMVRPGAVLVVLLCAALGASAARAPSRGGVEGRVLFTRYCSSCHGLDGDGHGPVASVLSRPPTDLRRLGDRFGPPLPADPLPPPLPRPAA